MNSKTKSLWSCRWPIGPMDTDPYGWQIGLMIVWRQRGATHQSNSCNSWTLGRIIRGYLLRQTCISIELKPPAGVGQMLRSANLAWRKNIFAGLVLLPPLYRFRAISLNFLSVNKTDLNYAMPSKLFVLLEMIISNNMGVVRPTRLTNWPSRQLCLTKRSLANKLGSCTLLLRFWVHV